MFRLFNVDFILFCARSVNWLDLLPDIAVV